MFNQNIFQLYSKIATDKILIMVIILLFNDFITNYNIPKPRSLFYKPGKYEKNSRHEGSISTLLNKFKK